MFGFGLLYFIYVHYMHIIADPMEGMKFDSEDMKVSYT